VWFMRQAGRSLPEYRVIRERHSFFEVANEPELCAEVTLQPVRRHDVDAAVMFADIMTPVVGMGIEVELVEGVGPVVEHPIRTAADVERLFVPDADEAFAPVLEAVRLVRSELPATGPSRGTSTRPCSPRRGTSSSARHSTCSHGPTVDRATSSTSVTACCRRPTRAT